MPLWTSADGARVKAILSMLASGLANHLLISQDTCMRIQMLKYGGVGYGYILRTIVPDLLSLGATQGDLDQILIDNPRRLLAF